MFVGHGFSRDINPAVSTPALAFDMQQLQNLNFGG